MGRLANPGPLGLAGFGMTTILLNVCNAGFLPLNSSVLAMGLAFGGFAQMCAGMLEYPKGNTFGLTAFTSYGAFWISLVLLIFMPKFGLVAPATPGAMAVYLGVWGIFTVFMFVGTLKANRVLQFIFGSLTVLFALLVAGEATGNTAITHFAGFEGLVCGAAALYLAMAEVLEEQFGRPVLPTGAQHQTVATSNPVHSVRVAAE
ncbi:acetate uptake transporter [Acetobacter sp.]|jgi:succinate-acetate transporter protein|uniref:acetate uptake transporter n=1 Tax=Acetobacter sp. TaxID=440 RepID=UPI0025C5C52B|nr:acetate uptake transporter [Acetobacter sp.]MCH4090526.1 acetate uptake transporter [Acetobacter sp.]MCI1299220.1 acetate uptake transporter [Acetobacter sp.]MCI1315767.1 acetate uptake transporter [Acetobacter sp.]